VPASVYTPELADEIVERVSQGEPLAQVCRDEHMPGLRTVYDWMDRDDALSARIARARVVGYDMIAVDAMRIADTVIEGVETEETENGIKVKRGDMLGHRKLQVETRLKLLAKWDPKRYGERVAHDVGGQPGNPLKTEAVSVSVDPDSLPADDRAALIRILHRNLQGAS
jgi:hypothetical protein